MKKPATSVLFAAAGLAVAGTAMAEPTAKKENKPNIIFILADDMGYGDLGCYGSAKIETPNIDALAKGGIKFVNSYAGTAVSAPSRCVLMTGLHSGHAYIRGNDEMGERGDVCSFVAMLNNPYLEGQRPLPDNTVTVAKLLKKAGYTTGLTGKWGLGYPGSVGTPNKMGFDFFYGYNCQRQAHTYYPPFLYRNENREYLDGNQVVEKELLPPDLDPYAMKSYAKYQQKQYSADLIEKEALGFIKDNADKPFFLYYASTLPHLPLQSKQKWIDHYVKKFGEEQPYNGSMGYYPVRYPHATYAAMVSYLDESVGKIVAELKELGIYDNTIIFFSSDNGPVTLAGADAVWFESARPFKSGNEWNKGTLREGGIRTPMIVSWPAQIKKPVVSEHIMGFWDMMPTFCDIAGVPASTYKTDGISILPTLLGKKQPQHDYLYWEFPEKTGSKAVRIGDWKAYLPDIKKGNTKIYLYNLADDPQESNDLSARYPEMVEKMAKIMDEAHRDPELERFKM